ncbi:hypothetical protein EYF80_022342 [Liparis tanakae]|uniref:Uncharacterized protein n=1 Tax=Liparis tanakae TaxID=230148 RepID=A0A4Z2HNQ8_9TELE|nr:hypothetical protein EYF80_022342 [Liparis tanakae]
MQRSYSWKMFCSFTMLLESAALRNMYQIVEEHVPNLEFKKGAIIKHRQRVSIDMSVGLRGSAAPGPSDQLQLCGLLYRCPVDAMESNNTPDDSTLLLAPSLAIGESSVEPEEKESLYSGAPCVSVGILNNSIDTCLV